MTKAQKHREAFFWGGAADSGLVERAARLKGPFGRSAKYFNVALRPGEDVTSRCFAVAGGQVVDLGDGKFPIPDIKVRKLSDKGLCCVKASSQRVLWRERHSVSPRCTVRLTGLLVMLERD